MRAGGGKAGPARQPSRLDQADFRVYHVTGGNVPTVAEKTLMRPI
jgi:hypothetical protein